MTDREFFRQLFRFSVVGTVGFVVDAGTLELFVAHTAMGPFSGRVVSYLCAATITWALNRRFTFSTALKAAPHAELARYVSVNAIGAGINYLVYSLLVVAAELVRAHLYLGVAAGSLCGLAFNFFLSRRWVFRHPD